MLPRVPYSTLWSYAFKPSIKLTLYMFMDLILSTSWELTNQNIQHSFLLQDVYSSTTYWKFSLESRWAPKIQHIQSLIHHLSHQISFLLLSPNPLNSQHPPILTSKLVTCFFYLLYCLIISWHVIESKFLTWSANQSN